MSKMLGKFGGRGTSLSSEIQGRGTTRNELLKRMYLWSNVSGLMTRGETGMNTPSSGLSKIITVEGNLGVEKAFSDRRLNQDTSKLELKLLWFA